MRHTLNQITLADLLQSEHRITDLLRSRLADAVLEPAESLVTLTPLSTVHLTAIGDGAKESEKEFDQEIR